MKTVKMLGIDVLNGMKYFFSRFYFDFLEENNRFILPSIYANYPYNANSRTIGIAWWKWSFCIFYGKRI